MMVFLISERRTIKCLEQEYQRVLQLFVCNLQEGHLISGQKLILLDEGTKWKVWPSSSINQSNHLVVTEARDAVL